MSETDRSALFGGAIPAGIQTKDVMRDDFGFEVPVESVPLPSNGVVCLILQRISEDLPCSIALRSMEAVMNGAAISKLNSWEEAQTTPVGVLAFAKRAVFQFLIRAPAFAVMANRPSFWFSGMVMAAIVPTPGGL